ncbi:hypothetical protein [Myxococcus sp. RHSTA-1-4]|uniref:hypothetical protein n=1 Tax=Myxococcus sp. RHSTA-1-4 TaxID=2874601 RepID=UPI001CC10501|nr:hypothetical protein [Myxococcus sp. RHSTA-1-4]MBZ4420412.1 hypothetical protein [Myxococcus sp. RHSTA-1-4]
MVKLKANKVLKIRGGGELPFAKPITEEKCPAGEHAERIYFPEIAPEEAHPLRRVEKMKEAGNEPFEVAAVEHNIKAGHITHGRQISRGVTPREKAAGMKGDTHHVRAVCIKCGASRELDHASSKTSSTECKNQDSSYGSDQMVNNKTLLERGFNVSYKVPDAKRGDRRLDVLKDAGFEIVFVKF